MHEVFLLFSALSHFCIFLLFVLSFLGPRYIEHWALRGKKVHFQEIYIMAVGAGLENCDEGKWNLSMHYPRNLQYFCSYCTVHTYSTVYKKYQIDSRVWILWSKHAACCETWEKRDKTRAASRVFSAFRKSSNIPSVWITVPKHGNPFGISFIK